ncbi:MAG: hypothetical protein Tsb002_08370 [Wenzhouxiangellaceae bacterium]
MKQLKYCTFQIAVILIALVINIPVFAHKLVLLDDEQDSGLQQPVIVVDEHVTLTPEKIDFGNVGVGLPISLPLRIENVNRRSMTVQISNNSAEISLSEEAIVLAPVGQLGNWTVITVTYDPLDFDTVLSDHLTIKSHESNPAFTIEQTVPINGVAVLPANLEFQQPFTPTILDSINFGQIVQNDWISIDFLIANVGEMVTNNGRIDGATSGGCITGQPVGMICFVERLDQTTQNLVDYEIEPNESIWAEVRIRPDRLGPFSVNVDFLGGIAPRTLEIRGEVLPPSPPQPLLQLLDYENPERVLTEINLSASERIHDEALEKWALLKNVGGASATVTVSGINGIGCLYEYDNTELNNKCIFDADWQGISSQSQIELAPGESLPIVLVWFYSDFESVDQWVADIQFSDVTGVSSIVVHCAIEQLDKAEPISTGTATDGDGLFGVTSPLDGARGVSTKNAFLTNTEIDTVNMLNGNLVVSIPIGQSYQVGPNFSYSLSLVHNANKWNEMTFGELTGTDDELFKDRRFTVPDITNNAGLGWRLSVGGELYTSPLVAGVGYNWPNTDQLSHWMYVDESGSHHTFWIRGDDDTVFHARGESLIRIRGIHNDEQVFVDLPNGVVKTFTRHEAFCNAFDAESGNAYCWRVTRIEDPFGNHVAVEYEDAIGNGRQRVHIYFNTNNSLQNNGERSIIVGFRHQYLEDGASGQETGLTQRTYVEYVKTPHFDPQDVKHAYWYFQTNVEIISRNCPVDRQPALPPGLERVTMPILSRVKIGVALDENQQPIGDNGAYVFDTLALHQPENSCVVFQGALDKIQLPGGSTIEYTYGNVESPSGCSGSGPGGNNEITVTNVQGVRKRKVFHPVFGIRDSNRYEYILEDWDPANAVCVRPNTMRTIVYNEIPVLGITSATNTETGEQCSYEENDEGNTQTDIEHCEGKYRHDVFFHSTTNHDHAQMEGGDWSPKDRGLPVTKKTEYSITTDNGKKLYLSSATLECKKNRFTAASLLETELITQGCVILRKQYLSHIYKSFGDNGDDGNERVCPIGFLNQFCLRYAAPVVMTRETSDGGTTYTETEFNGYDGFGHFRQLISRSSFSDHEQREVTNYTASDTTYAVASDGDIIGDLPLTTSNGKWLLNLFDYQESDNDGAIRRTEFDFAENGFLRCQRTLKDLGSSVEEPIRGDQDIAIRFTDIADTNQLADGFVDLEEYAGGDNNQQPLGTHCPPTGSSAMEYRLEHQYQHGVLAHSQFVGSDTPLIDYQVEAGSGLIKQACDHSVQPALCTTFGYDELGRLSLSDPQVSDATKASIHFAYSLTGNGGIITEKVVGAGGHSNPESLKKITIDASGNATKVELDASTDRTPSGKLVQHRAYYPNGTLNFVTPLSDSFWWSQLSSTGRRALRTKYQDYDIFGRLLLVKNPAGEIVSYGRGPKHGVIFETIKRPFYGSSECSESIQGKGVGVETRQDHLGRIKSITEGKEDSECSYRTTEYEYLNGQVKMKRVDGGVTQIRTERYDGRGFLAEESMPEKNTASKYFYDSRGNIVRKIDNDIELIYRYDADEQLQSISQQTASALLLLVDHEYDHRQLTQSIRYNYFDDINSDGFVRRLSDGAATALEFTVTDEFEYDTVHGLVDHKTTTIDRVFKDSQGIPVISGESASFVTNWTFDEFGRVKTVDYPRCDSGSWCDQGLNTVDRMMTKNHYDAGDLISTAASFDNGLTYKYLLTYEYHPSGVRKTVDRYRLSGSHTGYDRFEEHVIREATPGGDPELTMPRVGSISRHDSNGDVVWSTGDYIYNPRGLIKSIGDKTYQYDVVDRLVTADTETFIYDRFDNIDHVYDPLNCHDSSSTPSPSIETFLVDQATNRLSTVSLALVPPDQADPDTGCRPKLDVAIHYDARGNLQEMGDFKSRYDAFDKQIAWSHLLNNSTEARYQALYIHAADGSRVAVQDQHFGLGQSMLILSPYAGAGAKLRDFYQNGGSIGAKSYVGRDAIVEAGDFGDGPVPPRVAHLTSDHIGSARVMDALGEDLNIDQYWAYGAKIGNSNGHINQPSAFAGHDADRNGNTASSAESLEGRGLTTRTPTRTYLHVMGRFMQVDPANDGWNLYAYAGNNPLNSVDPLGLSGEPASSNSGVKDPYSNSREPEVTVPSTKVLGCFPLLTCVGGQDFLGDKKADHANTEISLGAKVLGTGVKATLANERNKVTDETTEKFNLSTTLLETGFAVEKNLTTGENVFIVSFPTKELKLTDGAFSVSDNAKVTLIDFNAIIFGANLTVDFGGETGQRIQNLPRALLDCAVGNPCF